MGTPGRGIVLASGRRGVLASGKSAIFDSAGACASCCLFINPCDFCTGAQPAAVITGGNPTPVECGWAVGTWDYLDHANFTNYCRWRWEIQAGAFYLIVYFHKATEKYCAVTLNYGQGPNTCYPYISSVTDVTDYVRCSGGYLTGAFDLVGWSNLPAWDCSAYTVHVSLNGA